MKTLNRVMVRVMVRVRAKVSVGVQLHYNYINRGVHTHLFYG